MPIQSVSQNSAGSATSASSGSSTTTSGNGSGGSLDTTFMSLLITELQAQDPTAPMDPTEMVGQMISLNQLDQLISINQLLQSTVGSNPATGASATTNGGK